MTMVRWIWRSVPVATVVLAAAAPMASAQWGRIRNDGAAGRELFEWSGSVDREKQIVMRGDRVWTNNVGRTEPRADRARAFTSMPRENGRVVVRVVNGRGDVDVIQQPSARNNYQTIVRVVDSRSGSDRYQLAAYWQSYGNGNNNGGIWGRDRDDYPRRDRNDNGTWDRGGMNNGRYGNNTALHWSGNVDDELEIHVRDGRIEYRTLHGAQPTSIRVTNGNLSSRTNATLGVVENQGRGSVTVTQQPSSRNGYTTVLRVKDPQGGYGYYDFDLVWQ
jgi:hypothetical protein